MRTGETVHLSLSEARGVALAAQRLLDPPQPDPQVEALHATIDQLGAVQIDTISVVERSQYLVLWSRLGPYDPELLDALLYPRRLTFEHWSHAASILPMTDYPYYRARMLGLGSDMWSGDRDWMGQNADILRRTLETVRERGPLASVEFERGQESRPTVPWDWYGAKDSRRALQLLWTLGDLMVHSRRGGQKVYDLADRVLAEAFGATVPRDGALPTAEEYLSHFVRRTVRALGVVTPGWLWDYFRLTPPDGAARTKRAAALALLDAGVEQGWLVKAEVEGLREPAYLAHESLDVLERLRGGLAPMRTTLLSPFDSLIWHQDRTRALWNYEKCFEAYVVPEKRRFGYYCLAILHQGRIVGRLDPKMDRAAHQLLVRAVYLEPEVMPNAALLDGIGAALRELARFLGATSVAVERATPPKLAPALNERLAVKRRVSRRVVRERAEA